MSTIYTQPTSDTKKTALQLWFMTIMLIMGVLWYNLNTTQRFLPTKKLDESIAKKLNVIHGIILFVDEEFENFEFLTKQQTINVKLNKMNKTRFNDLLKTNSFTQNEKRFIDRNNFDIKIYIMKDLNYNHSILEINDLTFLYKTSAIDQRINKLIEGINFKHTKLTGPSLDNEYILNFGLLNADVDTNIDWEVQPAIKDYFLEFYYRLSGVLKFEINSMIKNVENPLETKIHDDIYVLPSEAVDTIETQEFFIKDQLSNRQNINFMLYTHVKEQQPLFVESKQENIYQEALTIFPNKHVIINNLKSKMLTSYQLKNFMYTFASQFKFNLKLSNLGNLYHTFEIQKISGDEYLSEFETLTIIDALIKTNYREAREIVKNTLHLIKTMERITVTKEIAYLIDEIIHCLSQSQLTKQLSELLTTTRKARDLAKKLKTHPSMITLSTLPEEHKYAVYIPLYLPMVLPMLLSIVKSIKNKLKQLKETKRRKQQKED